MDSPIKADHVTYHHHSGPETPSEAAQNYAGAAFLIGMAIMAIGAGAGFLFGARGDAAAKMERAKRGKAEETAK
jgi:hypothetical protein